MSVSSPFVIVLSEEEEAALVARARSVRSKYRDRLRAGIVLAAAAGRTNAAIAVEVGVCQDTVRKWRGRFAIHRLPGLKDAPRSGRPPVYTAADRAELVALACALPAESDVPLSKWSCPELARELAARCHLTASVSTVRRWLAEDALKPWQHRSWISIRDPDFAVKAARVLDLYAGTWDGEPLGPNDFVICADEKTSIHHPHRAGEVYRLVTTIGDPEAAPAAELAEAYAQRWEIESVFDEIKTHQLEARPVLRSRDPDGVEQEIWGILLVHHAIRDLIHTSARDAGLDPDRVSFTRTLRAARRQVADQAGLSPLPAAPRRPRRRR